MLLPREYFKWRKFVFAVFCVSVCISLTLCFILLTSNEKPHSNIVSNKFLKENVGPMDLKVNNPSEGDNYKGNRHCPFIKEMNVKISYDTSTELTFLVDDANGPRFRPPYSHPFPFTKPSNKKFESEYTTSFTQRNNGVQFKVERVSTGETIFDTSDNEFIFSDKYIEVSSLLPTQFLYGLGERTHDLLYKEGVYTIWPFDQFGIVDHGELGNQTYGHHPVYLMREKSGNYHVVYFRNYNAMSFEFRSNKITFRTTGGVIEFKIFLGNKFPETAIVQYHRYINKWAVQPFWSFGFHQCRWGYKSSHEILEVVKKHQQYEIPLDVVWSDIDYMDGYQTFTVNENNFKNSDFQEIFSRKVRWVPIFDYGIKVADNDPYRRGVELDIFIKSEANNGNAINCVWPGPCVFPDFNHPNTPLYWKENLQKLTSLHHFDGIWNDMNEIATFRTGELSSSYEQCWENAPDWNKMGGGRLFLSKDLPYLPFPYNRYMESRTLTMTAYRHPKGRYMNSQADKILEYDVHSINGFLQSVTLYEVMQKNMNIELPFILTRSSAPGSGGFAVHWTGDNLSTWEFLRYSIADILSFQIYGMPVTGSDICGFMFNTNEELCARWFQLGAFYPFARNHNHNEARSQEAYAFGDNSVVFKAAKRSLQLRYSLLKYFYTLHVKEEGVGSLMKPMFFEFPEEERFFSMYSQFLFGKDLLVAPALWQFQKDVEVNFPANELFAHFFTGIIYHERCVNISSPLDEVAPLFIRQGAIVQYQDVKGVKTTNDLSSTFKLKIFLKPNEQPKEENFLVFGSYFANGFLLGVSDFNSSSITTNCLTSSCVVEIFANAKIEPKLNDKVMNLKLSFAGNLKSDSIKISEFDIYGLKKGDEFVPLNYKFTQEKAISIGEKIEVNIQF